MPDLSCTCVARGDGSCAACRLAEVPTLVLRVEGVEGMVAALRRRIARLVREFAATESPLVAARLRQVADAFEAERIFDGGA